MPANFKYPNLKSLYSAAVNDELEVPDDSLNTIEATEVRAKLKVLKEKSFKRIDEVYETVLKYAKLPFIDETARKHYQGVRATLAAFPQTIEETKQLRANLEKEIDEMARLGSRKVDHHAHHAAEGEPDDHASPEQEFESKYGLNLSELRETFSQFKSNQQFFLDNSIFQNFGKTGLETWKKSQEFSAQYEKLSISERTAAEDEFREYLKSA